jgi:hypothetical protein
MELEISGPYPSIDMVLVLFQRHAAPAGTPIPAASSGEVRVRDKDLLESIVRCRVGARSSGFGWK